MLTHNREALIPYHYCFEHKSSVPDVKDPEIMWHLPSKQIAVNRRGELRKGCSGSNYPVTSCVY